jgi:hypothetical protein
MTYFFQDGGKHDFEENLTLDGSRFQVFGSGFFCFQPMDVHLASRQVDHTMKDAFCVLLAPPSPPPEEATRSQVAQRVYHQLGWLQPQKLPEIAHRSKSSMNETKNIKK